jgi:GH24 family phage-related lysozyme (muramidase)
MTTLDTFGIAEMTAELMQAEGTVLYVYDDATGKQIVKGSVVKGNPSIGTGRNLAYGSTGISMAENYLLLGNDIVQAEMILDADPDWNTSSWSWRTALTPIRQRALINLVFNMGDHGLDEFVNFRAALEADNYAEAGAQLEASNWWNEVGKRGPRVQWMIVNGTVPSDEPAPAPVAPPSSP